MVSILTAGGGLFVFPDVGCSDWRRLQLGGWHLIQAVRQVSTGEDVLWVEVLLDGLEDADTGLRDGACQPLLAQLAHCQHRTHIIMDTLHSGARL